MPRWRNTSRDAEDLLATALPQLALDQPLTALTSMHMHS